MSNVETWSTTANSNNAAPPDGFPEGMAPSDVNNSAREMMAAIRRASLGSVSFGDLVHPTLDSILADATITTGNIIVPSGTHTLDASTNRTLLAGLNLVMSKGAVITVPTGRIFTVNGMIDAGPYQIFTLTGTGTIAFADGMTLKSSWFANLTTAVACIGASKIRLEITKSETISANLSTVATTNLYVLPGNILSIDETFTLTIGGTLEAGPYQIFDGLGTVVFGSDVYIQYEEWSAGNGTNIVLTTGTQTIAGVKTFSSFPVTPSSSPTTDYQVANKQYVDTVGTGLVAILQNRQAQGAGSGTATGSSWGIIPLNTEYEDPSNIVDATLLPAFTLVAGTYRIEAWMSFNSVYNIQCRLYNVTNDEVQQNIGTVPMDIYSISEQNGMTGGCKVYMSGTFIITDDKNQLRVEYFCTQTGTHGAPCSVGPEVYDVVTIFKR